jgi:hypothetical protein
MAIHVGSGCRADIGDGIKPQNYYAKMDGMRASVVLSCAAVIDQSVLLVRDQILEELDVSIAWLHAMEETE